MIKVLLFKLKQFYGNALKEYTDSQVQEMSKNIHHQSSDENLPKVYEYKKESGQRKTKGTQASKKRS